MARSLNPHAAGNPPPPPPPATPITPRRNLLAAASAVLIGGFVSLVPIAAGLGTFLDPILRRRRAAKGDGAARPPIRVASLAALPEGTPVQVPVIADLTNAWNREPNQPIGAVYLRRQGEEVTCFNAICPHAGCFVGYSAERKVFQCPCHTSSFELDGQRIMPSPSPRNMDNLIVELKEGEVWINFVNYYPGHEDREEKPS